MDIDGWLATGLLLHHLCRGVDRFAYVAEDPTAFNLCFKATVCLSMCFEIAPLQVVFMGLHLVIPLISPELLKFPKLCRQYFRLVAMLLEVHLRFLELLHSLRLCVFPIAVLQEAHSLLTRV